ncbi:MAG: class I SAM-dependent methyltransferase [Planctomycetaceae bacterium]|nr:class I SAM-dependent methyltransferase [Planctomycetaceae bacterium]MDG2391047.1 class I SAM-dependent methyltransferase [Planctomycetaceae bacterium]
MHSKLLFAKEFMTGNAALIGQRLRVLIHSLTFQPRELSNFHFHRYHNYRLIEAKLKETNLSENARIVEFGGSNGVVAGWLAPQHKVEVAADYPEVDVQNLAAYEDECCDMVLVDQILEHVPDPIKAVSEIHRILKPGGICVSTTPFLIRLHGYPYDFHRFTSDGLKTLFSEFLEIEVNGWGNRLTLRTFHKYGWLSAKNARILGRAALWNEHDWPIDYLTWAVK